eukprot:1548316-Amphidinium_carterae.1
MYCAPASQAPLGARLRWRPPQKQSSGGGGWHPTVQLPHRQIGQLRGSHTHLQHQFLVLELQLDANCLFSRVGGGPKTPCKVTLCGMSSYTKCRASPNLKASAAKGACGRPSKTLAPRSACQRPCGPQSFM